MPEEQTNLFFRFLVGLFFFFKRLPIFKVAAKDYLRRSTAVINTKLTSEK